MNKLSKNLHVTYSNQKVRELKRDNSINPLDKVITLESLMLELFDKKSFKLLIDDYLGASIIHTIIQENKIDYFSYLDADAASLNLIYSFIIKCQRNDVLVQDILRGDKLEAINLVMKHYTEFKHKHNLADISDVEKEVFENWEEYFVNSFEKIYVDDFQVGEINFLQSKYQELILQKLLKTGIHSGYEKVKGTCKTIKPTHEVFDNIDEVKTALRIARKLLENGVSSDEVLIVASDIEEYAPLFKLFLDEYALKGYTSAGTPLASFQNAQDPKVQATLEKYNTKIKTLEALSNKLGMKLSQEKKEQLKKTLRVLDEKVGIELTEPNQIVGLNRSYKHVIFIGVDINHFPPKSSDTFLCSYDDEIKHFYQNNFFSSSKTQLEELKRIAENLYIIVATHSGKRELAPSILLDGKYDDEIDLSDVKSATEFALEGLANISDEKTQEYCQSISSEYFTRYDGNDVHGLNAKHLSASQINKYISCPLAYLYGNKLDVKSPKQSEEGFDVMEQGSLMHLCFELFGRKIKDQKIKTTDIEELSKIMFDISIEAYNHDDTRRPKYKDEMVENIHHKIFLSNLQAGLMDEREAGLLKKFVHYYSKNASNFQYFQNTEFEKEFALDNELKPYVLKDKDDKNYFIKGFIDRFDNIDGKIDIIDYKSKKVARPDTKKQEEVDTQKDIQLALYILYASQAYPNQNYNSYLFSFKGNDNGVKFAKLSNEDVYTDDYDKSLRELIFETKKNIENGKFTYNNSDEKMCEWCDVKYLCHEKILDKKEMYDC